MWSPDDYTRTMTYAAACHGGQKMVSGQPYVTHLAMVAQEVMRAAAEEDFDVDYAVRCAILHDVLEDTFARYDALRERFGAKTADGVLALTKNFKLKKEERMPDSLRRIMLMRKEIWMVKLADRIVNLRDIPGIWSVKKAGEYLEEARLILESLGGASHWLSSRLSNKIRNYALLLKKKNH